MHNATLPWCCINSKIYEAVIMRMNNMLVMKSHQQLILVLLSEVAEMASGGPAQHVPDGCSNQSCSVVCFLWVLSVWSQTGTESLRVCWQVGLAAGRPACVSTVSATLDPQNSKLTGDKHERGGGGWAPWAVQHTDCFVVWEMVPVFDVIKFVSIPISFFYFISPLLSTF